MYNKRFKKYPGRFYLLSILRCTQLRQELKVLPLFLTSFKDTYGETFGSSRDIKEPKQF